MDHQNTTDNSFLQITNICKTIFKNKIEDYGMSWKVLRLPSITDQIFIKIYRIRTILEKKEQLVEDTINEDFIGIINYCIMGLVKLEYQNKDFNLDEKETLRKFNLIIEQVLELLHNKNHDYDEAWKLMRLGSIVDIILMKLERIKSIENKGGIVKHSENIDAGYKDIINYSFFCISKLKK